MNKISIDEQGFIMGLSNDPLFLTFNGKACIMDLNGNLFFGQLQLGKSTYLDEAPKFKYIFGWYGVVSNR